MFVMLRANIILNSNYLIAHFRIVPIASGGLLPVSGRDNQASVRRSGKSELYCSSHCVKM